MDYHESTLRQKESDEARDARFDARAEDLADELLEAGIVMVDDSPFATLVLDIEEDIALKIYENNGDEIVTMLATLLRARGVDSKRSAERFENELRAQLIALNNIGTELYMSECREMAEKETHDNV